jgi:hypothetical protein
MATIMNGAIMLKIVRNTNLKLSIVDHGAQYNYFVISYWNQVNAI